MLCPAPTAVSTRPGGAHQGKVVQQAWSAVHRPCVGEVLGGEPARAQDLQHPQPHRVGQRPRAEQQEVLVTLCRAAPAGSRSGCDAARRPRRPPGPSPAPGTARPSGVRGAGHRRASAPPRAISACGPAPGQVRPPATGLQPQVGPQAGLALRRQERVAPGRQHLAGRAACTGSESSRSSQGVRLEHGVVAREGRLQLGAGPPVAAGHGRQGGDAARARPAVDGRRRAWSGAARQDRCAATRSSRPSTVRGPRPAAATDSRLIQPNRPGARTSASRSRPAAAGHLAGQGRVHRRGRRASAGRRPTRWTSAGGRTCPSRPRSSGSPYRGRYSATGSGSVQRAGFLERGVVTDLGAQAREP